MTRKRYSRDCVKKSESKKPTTKKTQKKAYSPKPRIKGVTAKNEEQKQALRIIAEKDIVLIHGVAGTGKTHMAVNWGFSEVVKENFKQLILTRPCIEAYGEKLGSLPGDAEDKIAPYMFPLFELLYKCYDKQQINRFVDTQVIRCIPLAYMRGVTFDNAIVVADEMQNAVPAQVRLLLTRIGEESKIVITGDIRQSDLNRAKEINGMTDAINRLSDVDEVGIVEMSKKSIVRNPIIAKIETAYEKKPKE